MLTLSITTYTYCEHKGCQPRRINTLEIASIAVSARQRSLEPKMEP
jgi:hypothetical protein